MISWYRLQKEWAILLSTSLILRLIIYVRDPRVTTSFKEYLDINPCVMLKSDLLYISSNEYFDIEPCTAPYKTDLLYVCVAVKAFI